MNVSSMDIKNRVFLITGGTSGVGKAIAMGLARQGANIVIISRSSERGQQTLQEIAEVTGNDRGEYLVADLSLQSSIRQVSEEFKRKFDHLHVLANVGGAFHTKKEFTEEGFEKNFAVNYLGHFLLTNQLLDILKESSPSRILTVSGHPRFWKNGKINFEDIQLEKRYSSMRAFLQALLARTLFNFELGKRLEGTGVTAASFYPGFVKSSLAQNAPWFVKYFLTFMNRMASEECPIGVYLAAAKEVEQVNGVFFNDFMQIVPYHKQYDEEIGRKLWTISEQLTGRSAM